MIARAYREIPIDLVDEPDAPTRLAIDPAKLQDLISSIRTHGQLQPGGVVPVGDRFAVSYGHRRLMACRALELPVYCAYVYASESAAMLGAQLAENVDRDDLNPVEEAFWFAQLIDAGVGDTDELAQMLKRTRDYVETRLLLLSGDPDVREALQLGRIGLGVAKLLNGYAQADDRKVLLDAAVAGGASARLVATWIAERKTIAAALVGMPMINTAALADTPAADAPKPLCCLYCESDQEVYNMQPLWIHKVCFALLRNVLERHLGGFSARTIEELDRAHAAAHADR